MDTVLLQLDPSSAAAADATIDGAEAYKAAAPAAAKNLAVAFCNAARARANHPAVASKDGVFTYGAILRAAEGVRRYLCARPNYSAGFRVALQLSNSPEYLAAFYGTLLADGVVVPLPVPLEGLRRKTILDICRPDVLISRRQDIGAQGADSATLTLRLPGDASGDVPVPRRADRDLAMLLFTSGSTGTPKGVMLSHRNLLANASSILHELPIGADDRALAVLPFCHAFGNSILQTHILAGATLLLNTASMFPFAMVEALRESGATSFSAVPDVYIMLLRYGKLGEKPLPTLRYMSVAGGALRNELATQVAERIAPAPLYLMYGQAEATARLAALPPAQLHARRDSIGKPIWGVELSVRDDAGRELPAGATGMLCARGDNVMLGYWQDAAATADVFTADGWLRTGDLARRDEEGYLYLHGRANLLIKIQGHRVHPAEIEAVVETGFPHASAAAIPVVRGEETRFVLFLAPRDGQPIEVEKIRAACQRELPAYKLPLHFHVLNRLPLNSALKIDRAALGRLAQQLANAEEKSQV